MSPFLSSDNKQIRYAFYLHNKPNFNFSLVNCVVMFYHYFKMSSSIFYGSIVLSNDLIEKAESLLSTDAKIEIPSPSLWHGYCKNQNRRGAGRQSYQSSCNPFIVHSKKQWSNVDEKQKSCKITQKRRKYDTPSHSHLPSAQNHTVLSVKFVVMTKQPYSNMMKKHT